MSVCEPLQNTRFATENSCKLCGGVIYCITKWYQYGKKEKLINKLKSVPKDFTFDEAETLLGDLDYSRSNKGKTSGSRVVFTSNSHKTKILLHKPHPRNNLLEYQVKQLIEQLEQEGLL